MKSSPLLPVIFFLFAIMICAPSISPAEEVLPTQAVETEGSARITGGDLARARNEAVRDALQKAVEQVAGRWLAPQEVAKRSPVLKEQITDRAEGFIQEYKIVSEVTAVDHYTVAIRATVLADSLRNDLRGLGLIRQTQLKPSVSRISLTIRGIRTYGDYIRCREVLKEKIPEIREIVPREASWGLVRFDIAADGTAQTVAERLRDKLAVEIQRQDDRVLEVQLSEVKGYTR
ncbi:MAG: flagellar assembly protein T N-terminal domain-containing protein [Syntrophales bacterium]